MSTGKASRAPLNTFIIAIVAVLLLLLFALLIALLIRSGRLFNPLAASVGLPDAVPIESRLVSTVAPPEPVQPQPPAEPETPAPLTQPTPQPTAIPAPINPPVFPSDVEPVPVEGGVDDGSSAPVAAPSGGGMGSVEPYPVGAGSTGSSANRGSSGGSRVACGVRVVHVVQPGENLFRIALRYNTTIASIARRNGIADARTIRAGQRLTIITCR